MIKIGIDAGHGMNTPGKRTPDDEREWHFNNIVLYAFEQEMKKYKGVETRRFDDYTGKTDISLSARTNTSNKWGADYFISFHHNALAGKWGNHGGTEIFVYEKASKESVNFANALLPTLVSSTGLRNRGVKKGNLHMVRETNCPAILIEVGFMDSYTDIKLLRDTKKLANVGTQLAITTANYLKLTLKESAPIVSNKPEELSNWAKEAWEWATKEGITDGKRPKDTSNREEQVVMLYRLAQSLKK